MVNEFIASLVASEVQDWFQLFVKGTPWPGSCLKIRATNPFTTEWPTKIMLALMRSKCITKG